LKTQDGGEHGGEQGDVTKVPVKEKIVFPELREVHTALLEKHDQTQNLLTNALRREKAKEKAAREWKTSSLTSQNEYADSVASLKANDSKHASTLSVLKTSHKKALVDLGKSQAISMNKQIAESKATNASLALATKATNASHVLAMNAANCKIKGLEQTEKLSQKTIKGQYTHTHTHDHAHTNKHDHAHTHRHTHTHTHDHVHTHKHDHAHTHRHTHTHTHRFELTVEHVPVVTRLHQCTRRGSSS
jgi:hypothetical protein